jgi:hypothetical protein
MSGIYSAVERSIVLPLVLSGSHGQDVTDRGEAVKRR